MEIKKYAWLSVNASLYTRPTRTLQANIAAGSKTIIIAVRLYMDCCADFIFNAAMREVNECLASANIRSLEDATGIVKTIESAFTDRGIELRTSCEVRIYDRKEIPE